MVDCLIVVKVVFVDFFDCCVGDCVGLLIFGDCVYIFMLLIVDLVSVCD